MWVPRSAGGASSLSVMRRGYSTLGGRVYNVVFERDALVFCVALFVNGWLVGWLVRVLSARDVPVLLLRRPTTTVGCVLLHFVVVCF